MAYINYKNIIDDVVDKIEAYPSHSFRHVDRNDWIDNEGKLANSVVDNGFSVFIEGKAEDEDLASYNLGLLNLNIQFALTAMHNNYLSTLGYCEDAIIYLKNVSSTNLKINKADPYFTCEIEGDIVRVDFSDVKFTSPNK